MNERPPNVKGREIPGYPGFYITISGRVYGKRGARLEDAGNRAWLKDSRGKRVWVAIPRLVLYTYCGYPPNQYYKPGFKNGDKTDFHATNLYWEPSFQTDFVLALTLSAHMRDRLITQVKLEGKPRTHIIRKAVDLYLREQEAATIDDDLSPKKRGRQPRVLVPDLDERRDAPSQRYVVALREEPSEYSGA